MKDKIEKILSDKLNEGLIDGLDTPEILKKQAQAIVDSIYLDETVIYQRIIQIRNRDLKSMDEFLEEKEMARQLASSKEALKIKD